ncbi:restriction endonuclease subunit S [Enterococcus dispar]
MSNDIQPEIRFPGFTDDWEERKLKELFQPSKNKNNNGLYNQKDILAASLGTELIPKRTFFGLKSTRESVKNYRIVKTGDLIYTKSPIKGFPNGIIRSNKGNVGIVPPLYCVYTLQKDINSSIIQLYFEDKNRLDFYLFPLVNVGARNNVNITDLEFLEGKVTIPKSYEEQSKIVQFMEQLNTTIALHQRKLDLLKETKKGFLQKMFPKNGAKVPEVRFPGFTEDWEQRRLETLGEINRGKSKHRPRNDERLFGGEYPFIQTGDVAKSNLYLTNFSQTYSEFGIQQSKLWDEGTLLITIAANIADTAILGIKAAFPDSVIGFVSAENDVLFLKNAIDVNSNLLRQKAETSSQANLNLAKLKEMIINIPQIEEQQKIGTLLQKIDDTITLHQRKLDLLKETKKGFLQKMFV